MKIIYLVILTTYVLCTACAGGGVSDPPNEVQYNSDRNFQDIKSGIVRPSHAYETKAAQSTENVADFKKNSPYGISKLQLNCTRSETDWGALAATLPLQMALQTNLSDSYSICKRYEYTYWLKLNWACESENTGFIKNKTVQAVKNGVDLFLLDADGNQLQKLQLKMNSNYESFDILEDTVFNKFARLKVSAGSDLAWFDKTALTKTLFLPRAACKSH